MKPKIAVQLYSVRDLLPGHFEEVVTKIAEMGYDGVETAGFPGTTPQAAGNLFKTLGLQVCSIHSFPLPVGELFTQAASVLEAVNCSQIVSGYGPDRFHTEADVLQVCDEINACARQCAAHGYQLVIHNHWWEYTLTDGWYPYELMLKNCDPAVGFEVDTYWVKVGGVDPAKAVGQMGDRASLLHIKDGPCVKDQPNVAVGSGVMDIPAIAKAGADHTKWWIVEFDHCATDVLLAVKQSVDYLKAL